MAALPDGELENMFADINEEVDYASGIIPSRENAASFKIDGSINTMLKVNGQFRKSMSKDPHQHFKIFFELLSEQLFEAWERFRRYILRAHNHRFPDHIREVLYRLDALKQPVANNDTFRCFMEKTFNKIAIILDKIAKHNYAWHGGDQSGGINVGTPSLSHLIKENQDHDQMMASMEINVALLIKKLTKFEVNKVDAINETITEVQYGHGCPPSPYQYQSFTEPPPLQMEDAKFWKLI
ncbi:hypothetical protein HAX54_007367 [Datura stramonium]|uniref:Retrotransposon gag domain-containing protein n=1 Tax=Datura stramonium TaxID=4076 RepID=A0ABS8TBT9_DATST|nr:hypothetical protein [Datura stramonium]